MKTRVTIRFRVQADGQVQMHVEGLPGPACHALTADIENLLGPAVHRERTAEYYQQPAPAPRTEIGRAPQP